MSIRVSALVVAAAIAAACSPNGSQSSGAGQAAPPAGAPAVTTSSATPPAAESSAATGAAPPAAATGHANAPAAAPAAAATPAPVELPKAQFREVTIPAGTRLSLKLATAVASDTSKIEDPVRATLSKPIVIGSATVVPAGAEVVGTVLEANRSGRVKGRASIAFRFDRLSAHRETQDIRTARIARQAAATKKEDAKKIGIGAGAGAIIGAIAGGKKGAAIGGGIGAGAGAGTVLATRGDEVRLAVGAPISTTLQAAVAVRIPVD